MNVLWEKNVLDPILYMKQRSLTSDKCKRYLGTSEKTFNERFRNHTRGYKHKKYEKSTEPSKYIWNLKSYGIAPIINWSIVIRVSSKRSANYCKLCLRSFTSFCPSTIKIC